MFSIFVFALPLETLSRHQADTLRWIATWAACATFLALFAAVLIAQHQKRSTLWALSCLIALGVAFTPSIASACVFWAYAASFAPYAVRGHMKPTAALLLLMMGTLALEAWIGDLPWQLWVFSMAYIVVMGVGQTWAARQAFSVTRLATIAERERIARDLHDVLGHTLSLIILKSELAGRVLEQDPARAKAEIGDVERISREALNEVRQTIRGYRESSLHSEFERARTVLQTAGVAVECDYKDAPPTPDQQSVLSLALREAVTNVIRHAQARTCRLQLQKIGTEYQLEIQDDGRGSTQPEGSGLRGMRERIEAWGGTVLVDAAHGTKLTITLPLKASVSA